MARNCGSGLRSWDNESGAANQLAAWQLATPQKLLKQLLQTFITTNIDNRFATGLVSPRRRFQTGAAIFL